MKFDIIRAWKDEAYRSSLSTQEQALLPENPAGALELSDAELEAIHGADGGGDSADGCNYHTHGNNARSTVEYIVTSSDPNNRTDVNPVGIEC